MVNPKMKKTIATMCMGAAVLTLTPAVSWAETAVNSLNNQQESMISPYMLYIEGADYSLKITGNTAKVECSVSGNTDTATKAKVIAELQVKNGNSWIPVEIWTVTENSDYAEVSETHTVTSGNTYRVKATMTVWEGSLSETQTFYTNEKTAEI